MHVTLVWLPTDSGEEHDPKVAHFAGRMATVVWKVALHDVQRRSRLVLLMFHRVGLRIWAVRLSHPGLRW